MSIWLIGVCSVGYLLVGAVVSGLVARLNGDMPSRGLACALLFLWPLLVVFMVFSLIIVVVAGDKATERYKKHRG